MPDTDDRGQDRRPKGHVSLQLANVGQVRLDSVEIRQPPFHPRVHVPLDVQHASGRHVVKVARVRSRLEVVAEHVLRVAFAGVNAKGPARRLTASKPIFQLLRKIWLGQVGRLAKLEPGTATVNRFQRTDRLTVAVRSQEQLLFLAMVRLPPVDPIELIDHGLHGAGQATRAARLLRRLGHESLTQHEAGKIRQGRLGSREGRMEHSRRPGDRHQFPLGLKDRAVAAVFPIVGLAHRRGRRPAVERAVARFVAEVFERINQVAPRRLRHGSLGVESECHGPILRRLFEDAALDEELLKLGTLGFKPGLDGVDGRGFREGHISLRTSGLSRPPSPHRGLRYR